MTAVNLQDALGRAAAWSHEAGAVALARFGGDLTATRKRDRSLVTDVDLHLQELIVKHITEEFPTHGILAEEGGAEGGSSNADAVWVVDPLDGTRNFSRGIPCFTVAIALMCAGRPELGVVRDPVGDRTYMGSRGGGAYVNGRRLNVTLGDMHEDTIVGLSVRKAAGLPEGVTRQWFNDAIQRNLGSASLLIALTAAGALDGCYGRGTKLWDVAPGALLIEEAGGILTGSSGERLFPIDPNAYAGEEVSFLAAGPRLHEALLRTLDA